VTVPGIRFEPYVAPEQCMEGLLFRPTPGFPRSS